MEPKIKFNHDRVEKIVQTILDNRMKGVARCASVPKNPENIDELTLSINDEIRTGVRELSYERYRLVVVLSVGELVGGVADVMFSSRCLWDCLLYTSPSPRD